MVNMSLTQKLCNGVRLPLVSHGYQSKPSDPAGNDVITTEPWNANSIYDQFTMKTTVDEIINVTAEGQKYTQALAADAMQTHTRNPSFT